MSRRRSRSDSPGSGTRLQKLLADAGIASRRAAEELIRQGRVRLNGRVVQQLGTRADPRRDRVTVDRRAIGRPAPRASYLVYKPRGVVTSTRDPHAVRTVLDLLPARCRAERLFPVGRLDSKSEGLLLLTNDGELAQAMLHPSFEVPRTYRVSVTGQVSPQTVAKLARGVTIRGRLSAPASVALLARESERSVLELSLHEGRKHQIRELLRAAGHPVRRLVRTRFGPLELRGLRPGEWRPLSRQEQAALARLPGARGGARGAAHRQPAR